MLDGGVKKGDPDSSSDETEGDEDGDGGGAEEAKAGGVKALWGRFWNTVRETDDFK